MNRDDLDSLDKEALIQLVVAQADAIAALTQQVEKLTARLSGLEAENVSLRAENAALREKLKLPPKTPDNSSKPPLQGQKPSGEPAARESKDRRKAHAGAHRPRIRIRRTSATFWPSVARIAERMCRAQRKRRSTPTIGSRFLRSSRMSRG